MPPVSRDLHLFNAPIFYPEPRALAFSDAMLLPGLAAAPLRFAGLSPLTAYNLALIAAFVTSGLAMFVLVRFLSGRADAALIAAVTFTLAPYRLDHLDHFEMQMAMWMPIGLWLWHRAADRDRHATVPARSWPRSCQWLSLHLLRDAVCAGVCDRHPGGMGQCGEGARREDVRRARGGGRGRRTGRRPLFAAVPRQSRSDRRSPSAGRGPLQRHHRQLLCRPSAQRDLRKAADGLWRIRNPVVPGSPGHRADRRRPRVRAVEPAPMGLRGDGAWSPSICRSGPMDSCFRCCGNSCCRTADFARRLARA